MKRFKCKRLNGWAIALVSLLTLYSAANLVPAYAGAYIFDPVEKLCMADAYLLEPGNSLPKNSLNCTANDVEITKVSPTDPAAECSLGETFSFEADVTVRTNANERWDTTFYLPLTELSPQVVHGAGQKDCSLILPIPGDSGETADVELDGDACGDITKALGPDQYILTAQTITMLCADEDNDNRADFSYCAAWDNQERDNCTVEEDPYSGQIPNTKSKCNCDTFNIDVFIKPNPPTVSKTLVGTDTHTEPGGVYTFDVDFDNPNSNTSIFLTSLTDEIDIFADGLYDVSLDLWGTPAPAPATDGVYLTASNCSQPANGGEILPSGSYSCRFSVTIVDSDLPDDQSPELYNDVIQLSLKDKNNDPVLNGETCPEDIAGTAGNFCSEPLQVNVTNLPPDISVDKSADKDEVLEPGEDVTFYIAVTNNSDPWDSPVTLTSLIDDIYGDLNGVGTCATGDTITIAQGATYNCSFTEFVAGDKDDSFTNTVEATARDNEYDTDTAEDSHTVLVLDVTSDIDLVKTADPTVVLETGDDVDLYRYVTFTFDFSVDSDGVDNVTFSSLIDTVFGDITDECNFGTEAVPELNLLDGLVLAPGESDSCFIIRGLQGDDDATHLDIATISGSDDDGQPVSAMDDATVEFDPVDPASDMAFATSMLVVLEMHNAGIENITLSSITLKGINVVDGAGNTDFDILNSDGGSYAGISYSACNIGEVLGYNGSATDTYSCAFTIELKPGLENADDINFQATLANGVVVTFTDDDGETSSNAVGIQVITDEP